jgi:cytochrome c oxidase subunit 2
MVAAVLAVAACGGGDDDGATADGGDEGPAPSDAITVLAYDRLAFDAEAYSAPAGEITFTYVNEGVIPHTLVVEGFESEMKLTVNSGGEEVTGSITLEPGEYVLYCDVPGHRSGGMVADLTVG